MKQIDKYEQQIEIFKSQREESKKKIQNIEKLNIKHSA